jgi:Ca2+-binding RTX toxin-like protein
MRNRSIDVVNGQFTDTFANAWTVHIYHVNDGAVPPPPSGGTVSVSDASISEGNSGTTAATFTVTRSGGTAAFDVNYSTSDGTATVADNDYVGATNTLHFAANQNTATISITINGDTKVEANETFNVNLSNPTNGATISDGLGVGTIANDDVAPPPPPPGETIVGTSGNDFLVGTAGDDTISGLAGSDTINGAGGADTLSGGKGHDLFVFHAGEADGDLILDFHNKGRSSDQLEFSGFGQGTFTQIDTTHWAIGYENNSHAPEVIEILGASVGLNDYHFIV